MPISLNHLKNDKRSVDVEYSGDSVHLVYRPSELTPTVMAEMRDANEDGNDYFTVEILCKLLLEWDVMDAGDPPTPLPIVFDELKSLPSAFLSTLLTACTEDMFSKKKSGRR